jgi:glycosyltransferase EpsE
MKSFPDISVIFPVFNEPVLTLEKSLKSILNQSFMNFELIIVDDSDSIVTKEFLNKESNLDRRIKLIRPKIRNGLASALNVGISHSIGFFIARADADDFQMQNRLEVQLNFLVENPNVGVVGSFVNNVDINCNYIGVKEFPVNDRDIKRYSALFNPICHPSVMFRKTLIDSFGGYSINFRAAEDYEMWMRFIKHGVIFSNIPIPLLNYHLADSDRRNQTNWKFNLRAKLSHFTFDDLFFRILGLIIIVIMIISPHKVKSFFYFLYIRLSSKNKI